MLIGQVVQKMKLKDIEHENFGKTTKLHINSVICLLVFTMRKQLQANHCLITWFQIWYQSLLWGATGVNSEYSETQNCFSTSKPRDY